MNIFFLSYSAKRAAWYHCNRHCVKMIVETMQMLSTCVRLLYDTDNEILYKITHVNHPTCVWVRTSKENFEWTIKFARFLCQEYTFRYNKIHKSQAILEYIISIKDLIIFENTDYTEPPLCMPDMYKTDDLVESYRNYYLGDKSRFAQWKIRDIPYWYKVIEN
jgi:hypothetical protein